MKPLLMAGWSWKRLRDEPAAQTEQGGGEEAAEAQVNKLAVCMLVAVRKLTSSSERVSSDTQPGYKGVFLFKTTLIHLSECVRVVLRAGLKQ